MVIHDAILRLMSLITLAVMGAIALTTLNFLSFKVALYAALDFGMINLMLKKTKNLLSKKAKCLFESLLRRANSN